MSGAPIDLKAEIDAYGRGQGPYDPDKLAAVRRRRSGRDAAPAPISEKIREAIESGQIHAATREQLIEALQWLHPRVAEVERDLDQMRAQYIEVLAFWHSVNAGEATVKRKLGSELMKTTKQIERVVVAKEIHTANRNKPRSDQSDARQALILTQLNLIAKDPKATAPTDKDILKWLDAKAGAVRDELIASLNANRQEKNLRPLGVTEENQALINDGVHRTQLMGLLNHSAGKLKGWSLRTIKQDRQDLTAAGKNPFR